MVVFAAGSKELAAVIYEILFCGHEMFGWTERQYCGQM
jgi:hypothetical protein